MKTNLLVVFASLALFFFIGISMVTPPNPETPVLPEMVYDYTPGNQQIYTTFSNFPLFEVNDDKATLGRVLFYDTRLSKLQDISCGSCHKQEFSFADNKAFSEGINNILTSRNTPNLNDLGWRRQNHDLFWDYRETSLKDLIVQPVENPNELAGNLDEIVVRLKSAKFYDKLFDAAFGDLEINMDRASEAIEHFILAMTTFNSKYDQAYISPDLNLSAAERSGELFFTSFCSQCHANRSFETFGSALTTNNGLDSLYEGDPGMSAWADIEELGVFRAPSLRNIELTAPYMHDGSLETLEEVIEHYSENISQNPDLFQSPYYGDVPLAPPGLTGFGLGLTNEAKESLLAFLLTLTDKTFTTDPKFSNPFPSATTSTNHQAELLTNVKVFPNPAKDFVNITHPNQVNIQLFDLHGRLLLEEVSKAGMHNLQRNGLAKGMYILKISDGQKEKVEQIFFD